MQRFDVIVIGGGHAGAEAAWASSRLGAETALVTMEMSAIGRMSCNPAIGGLGKGHMVREIDALGGLMGLVIDATGIQFRMLNTSKGPAVWAPRAQADRECYAFELRGILERAERLTLVEGTVEDLCTAHGIDGHGARISGIRLTDGRDLSADAVIVTTGTFMRSLMHCGARQTPGGRVGERTSGGLSERLMSLGFELGRLKTGTPPRIHRDSIDYDVVTAQPGDDVPAPFSFLTTSIERPQVCCWVTYTNERTHEIIRNHLHLAPMYNGQIESSGPRYCPSVEDKVVRFADRSRHQVFLEPEGYDHERVYCNGISTSLPADVQREMVRSICGLERAEIIQPGYAVEYDWVPTHQINSTLETKRIGGLFLAGQINGTSGYEEAAAQGLMAGVNAVRLLRGESPLILGREQAYIGVMIDDLITKPPTEPYRMFTSRAEHRLQLRAENADRRLTPIGRRYGLVDDRRWRVFEAFRDEIERIGRFVENRHWMGRPVLEVLRGPDGNGEAFQSWLADQGLWEISPLACRSVWIDTRYSGYVARQQRQIERLNRMESLILPAELDYENVAELSHEAREKLRRIQPRTLGQASRISAITPADVTVLWVLVCKNRCAQQTGQVAPRTASGGPYLPVN